MEFTVYDIALVPIIVLLVEVIKRLGLPKRILPILNIFLGLIAAFVYITNDPKEAVLIGLVMGFSAMGLWSGAKNTVVKKED